MDRQKVIALDVDWRIEWDVWAAIVAVTLAGGWMESPVLSGVAAGAAIIWFVGFDWHTVDKHLKEMAQHGDVYRAKMSDRETLWWDREMPF